MRPGADDAMATENAALVWPWYFAVIWAVAPMIPYGAITETWVADA
jgi:hypothetical protein